MNDTLSDERRLVRRMISGEEEAFETFFAAHCPPLYRFALKRSGGDAEAAEEVVQRTFCAAIDKIATWRGEARLLTWLCAICRHELAGYFRRTSRVSGRVELTEELPEVRAALESLLQGGSDPEEQTLRREIAGLVHVALDSLPPRYGQALEWKYLEDVSMKEIALRLDATPKAVESLLTRARGALSDALEALLSGLGRRKMAGGDNG